MRKKKPIHKFNGGRGATLCHECKVIISIGMTDDLYCEEHGGEPRWRYKLVREHDGLTHKGNVAYWVEWDENSRGKDKHIDPAIGYSFILDPVYGNYQWLTTPVTEIVETKENYIKFKTKNSTYELFTNPAKTDENSNNK
jgi:hypothetical protein